MVFTLFMIIFKTFIEKENQESFYVWMVKQNMVHPYHRIKPSNFFKWSNNLDGSQGHYAEWKKHPIPKGHI